MTRAPAGGGSSFGVGSYSHEKKKMNERRWEMGRDEKSEGRKNQECRINGGSTRGDRDGP